MSKFPKTVTGTCWILKTTSSSTWKSQSVQPSHTCLASSRRDSSKPPRARYLSGFHCCMAWSQKHRFYCGLFNTMSNARTRVRLFIYWSRSLSLSLSASIQIQNNIRQQHAVHSDSVTHKYKLEWPWEPSARKNSQGLSDALVHSSFMVHVLLHEHWRC